MTRRVAVVDAVQTNHGEKLDDNVQEMMFDVVRRLMDRVGMDRSDIGTVISSSSDYWQGISCSNSYYFDAAGANLKSGSKVAEDSAFAFIYGMMRILSGHYRTALVVSSTKCSESPSVHTLTSVSGDPFFQRPIGLNEVVAAAFQAQAHVERYSVSREQAARVVVKNMSHAKKNPHSHRGGDLTIDEVLASPVMVAPFREMDVPATSDGAVAVLLADADTAKDLTDTPVFVQGVGWSADGYLLGDRDLLDGSLRKAAEKAYRMAGVEDPSREIDVAELCDVSSFQEIMSTEQLGFCEPGKGCRLVEDGVTAMDGRLPVNPSGGLFGAHPYVARGLIRIAEAAMQVKGEAGDHQVGDVKRALAQGVHGLGGQSNSVVILGN